MNPGNSGTSKSRALVCELLAMKLLREFSTRELVCARQRSAVNTSLMISVDRYVWDDVTRMIYVLLC